MSETGRDSLLAESRDRLSHLLTLLLDSLFGPLRTMKEIPSSDSCTLLRKSAHEILFAYCEVAGNLTQRKWTRFAREYCLEKRLYAGDIALRTWQTVLEARRRARDHVGIQFFLQLFWFNGHELEWRKIQDVADGKDIGQRRRAQSRLPR